MSDPKRWLDEGGGATLEERALLHAGRGAVMASALRKRVWVGVATGAASLGAVSEAAGALGGAAANKGVLLTLATSVTAKGVIAVGLVVATGVGVAALRSSAKQMPAVSLPAAVAQPTVERAASGRQDDIPADRADSDDRNGSNGEQLPRGEMYASPIGEAARAGAPSPGGGASGVSRSHAASRSAGSRSAVLASSADHDRGLRETPAESRTASRLSEESAAVLAIRKALLGGDADLALRMLERARVEFPDGALVEEREALAVRALVTSGRTELARQRGEAFLRAFPRSPHAAEVRAILAP